ncbi:hypothetical protein HNV10_17010 [Winogradskyella litoriviva]|uniref:PH domain-containing protein n=1 Tax=Winogradskyella litoriviva TaxID=1220182 RepID=A0ABX2EA77_9FLAO|nr:hypothetical protein [Winogradskyella litoriviva]NRD24953.1 hypothetical protein [Winogradskyella litoriviva]
MEFEPEYFSGILKVLILTMLVSIVPIYFTENWTLILGVSLIGFLAIILLNNKKWIKKVTLDFENKVICIKYPLNLIGANKTQIEFKEIEKVTYYEYMSRTPAHYKIEYNAGKLRFNCGGNESEKISSNLKTYGIETNFYNKKKEVGYR